MATDPQINELVKQTAIISQEIANMNHRVQSMQTDLHRYHDEIVKLEESDKKKFQPFNPLLMN